MKDTPPSTAFLKHRRRTYAWRGAGIGALLGILTLGGMALWAIKSSKPDAIEGMVFLQVWLGAPVYMFLGAVLSFLIAIVNSMGMLGHWIAMALGPLIYLSIPLNWGMLGFVIGWLAGNPRTSTKEANRPA